MGKREVLVHIDYGNKRVNYYYEVPIEHSLGKTDWCNDTFGYSKWLYTRVNGYPAYYFTKQKHAMFFKLRWTGNLTSTE